MKYRVRMGLSPQKTHSFRDFDNLQDALAFMWAMSKVPHPEKCWLYQHMDGYLGNSHMKNMPIPNTLLEKTMRFIEEDKINYEVTQ